MLKQKTEYSRYYGDFRGVDFSSDHTLVSERRFPYLVNMYKDYAAGAGQGIETIPGFRRRFVAPTVTGEDGKPKSNKIHGIHSFKDKSGKRRVYVHAGDRLYGWNNYPEYTGEAREVIAVAKEYDEHSSAIEGVGIATDYAEVSVEYTSSADVRVLDIRAIRVAGAQKWVSVYPRAVFADEPTNTVYLPEAYMVTTTDIENGQRARVVFPKVIKDSNGTVIASFAAGDTVEVAYAVVRGWGFFSSRGNLERISIYGTALDGRTVYMFDYYVGSASGYQLITDYNLIGSLTCLDKTEIPERLRGEISAAKKVKHIQYSKSYNLEPIRWSSRYSTSQMHIYVFCYKDESYVDETGENSQYYQELENGEPIYVLKENCIVASEEADGAVIRVTRVNSTCSSKSATALEFDEYAAEGKSDYVSLSVGGSFDGLSHVWRGVGGEIDLAKCRTAGDILLVPKDLLSAGDRAVIRFGETAATEISSKMSEHESQSFVFNNRLYILDGKNYLYIDVTPEEKIEVETEVETETGIETRTEIKVKPEETVVKRVADEAYIPTTYINIVVGGENADAGTEYEPRNMLSPYFKHTFVPVDSVTEYCMNERDLDGIKEVKVYGKVMKEGEDADYTVDLTDGKVIFSTPPELVKAGFEAVAGTPGLKYTLTDEGTYVCSGRGTAEGTEIVIGNYYNGARVKEIGNAFNNKGLTSVRISEGVISAGDYSFAGNSSLKTVEFPNSLEHIGFLAFRASGVTELTIPKRVKTIDGFAFEESKNLHTVEFKGKPQDVSSRAFQGCENLENVTVAWSKGAFPWLEDNLESLGATITYKGESADEEEDELYYPEAYAGVEITAVKAVYKASDVVTKNKDGVTTTFKKYDGMDEKVVSMIETATLCVIYDGRVFFSGIPGKPNLVLWCGRNLTGHVDPSYIGILNYVEDGLGNSPITAMIPLANTLLVLKGDTEFDGAVYYHTPYETGIDVMPVTYPSEHGLTGIGCLGAACNFLDDPVFISRLGLEAIGQLSVRYERAREHRSSLIDAKLVNSPGLRDAKMCEWGGYLVLLVDGRIFLADSRQVYQNDRGEVEYEWYYLEDIGVFKNQRERFEYLTEWPSVFMREKEDETIPQSSETTAPFTQGSLTSDTTASTERVPMTVDYDGYSCEVKLASEVYGADVPAEIDNATPVVHSIVEIRYTVDGKEERKAYQYSAAIYKENGVPKYALLCDGDDEMIEGEFSPAVVVKSIEDECKADSAKGRIVENLFFGTENGVVCSFNFDMREADGTILAEHYTFDKRAIYSGCALKMDNCGIPHMTKTTVKKSTVIKVKSFQSTAAKVRVRTNVNPYNEIARINATRFSFDNLDFSDFSFVCGEDSLFSVKEKEKKWVEKQYFIYSDEYQKPFALFYAAFKYFVAGKFKK